MGSRLFVGGIRGTLSCAGFVFKIGIDDVSGVSLSPMKLFLRSQAVTASSVDIDTIIMTMA